MDHYSAQLMEDVVLEPKTNAVSNLRKSNPKNTNASSSKLKPEKQYKGLKVEMQTLRMSPESEKMLYEVLRSVFGPNYKLADISEFENKNSNLGKQYWLQRGNLVIKGFTDYSSRDNTVKSQEQIIETFATSKLESYNFHPSHCAEALSHTQGHLGKALEVLFCKYYGIENLPKKDFIEGVDDNDLREKRNDEKEALESIYSDVFTEKIKNQVWEFQVKLNYLVETDDEKVVKTKPKLQLNDICRLYLAGNCRYGIKCKFRHQKPKLEELPKPKRDPYFTLEVRFPEGCKYPYEPPYFFFYKNDGIYSPINCLRIGRRLYNEALDLYNDGTPIIFSIISLLETGSEIEAYLKENKEQFLDQDEPLFSKSIVSEDIGPLHYTKGNTIKNNRNGYTAEDVVIQNQEIKKNFMDKQHSSQYLKMKEDRKKLPAWSKMDELLKTIHQNQITIVSGETGCGKSTQVPQFILDDWIVNMTEEDRKHVNVVCTQPRRISAVGVAKRVAAERIEKIGETVGYQIRLENKVSSKTRLTFCTTGILLQRMSSDSELKSVTHIIVDEVHERSAESDFLLMLIKKLIRKRRNLKVILMSATLKSDVFSAYFGKIPLLDIPGRTFPVQQLFLEDILEKSKFVVEENSKYTRKFKGGWDNLNLNLDLADVASLAQVPPTNTIMDENLTLPQIIARYSTYSKLSQKYLYVIDHEKINYDLIEKVLEWIVDGDHDYARTGSILVFLPGIAEIMTLKEILNDNKLLSPKSLKFIIIPLHSTLSSEEQSLVFKKPPVGVRKIVLSTNIAETSVTIDDCVFVIDTGKMKETRFNTDKNMESLETCWVSRANARQRMGRAGRVMPGVCIHLYTSFRYKYSFLLEPIPEILRVSLDSILLRIKILHHNENIDLFEVLGRMIEPPTTESIATAIKRLQDVGALDPEIMLTPLGHHLAALPIDVQIGKLILFGAIFCCLDSALTIAACLSHKSPFLTPFDKKQEVYAKKKQFMVAHSDQLTTLRAYRRWLEVSERGYQAGLAFANENFLSVRALQTIADVKHQLLELLVSIGFVPINVKKRPIGQDRVLGMTGSELNVNNDNYNLLQGLLCAALYPNLVKVLTPEKTFQIQSTGAIPRQPKPEELRFQTKDGGFVNIHPSSINFTVGYYSSPYLVYQEKLKTSRIFIKEVTMVPMLALVLFSGYGIDIELHNGTFIISLGDGWIMFATESLRTAQLLQHVRVELVKLLKQKMEDPLLNLVNHPNGRKIIQTIVTIVSLNH
ncbi:putative ATP-dependent RNA helicase DHX57 [Copidosoma floridanum]|uniref:putative ATP-dependent RNA helicase DHX57 n=1 Tax=Copidosoma floridanum TaxID=29053 RepID=UPI0006C94FB4|nr:putative ATP-dependent RNA helicase DHX57 [Copidosoma floridanum]